MIVTVLVVAGLVCLLLAAIGAPSGRVSLGWMGLFLLALAHVVAGEIGRLAV